MAEKTNERKCKKRYLTGEDDGEGNAHATENATALQFAFANGTNVVVAVKDFPDSIQHCLTLFGISEKLGNAYAASESPDDAHNKMLAMYERLAAGEWISAREAQGPRIGLLVQAIIRAHETAGKEVDEIAVAEKLKGNKELRDKTLTNPQVNAAYEAIKAENAAAKAVKAAEAAAGIDVTELEDMF